MDQLLPPPINDTVPSPSVPVGRADALPRAPGDVPYRHPFLNNDTE